MSYEPPTPPADLPTEVSSSLNRSTLGRLREIAAYAETLAEHKKRKAHLEESVAREEVEERPDDLPGDVPTKAAITIKKINNSRYYYWQWREGGKVTSEYKGSVSPSE